MRLGLNWADAATVVVSTMGIYVAFLVFIHIIGQRTMATRPPSSTRSSVVSPPMGPHRSGEGIRRDL